MSTNTDFEPHDNPSLAFKLFKCEYCMKQKPFATRDRDGNILYQFMYPQIIPFEYSSPIVAEILKYGEIMVCDECMEFMI